MRSPKELEFLLASERLALRGERLTRTRLGDGGREVGSFGPPVVACAASGFFSSGFFSGSAAAFSDSPSFFSPSFMPAAFEKRSSIFAMIRSSNFASMASMRSSVEGAFVSFGFVSQQAA